MASAAVLYPVIIANVDGNVAENIVNLDLDDFVLGARHRTEPDSTASPERQTDLEERFVRQGFYLPDSVDHDDDDGSRYSDDHDKGSVDDFHSKSKSFSDPGHYSEFRERDARSGYSSLVSEYQSQKHVREVDSGTTLAGCDTQPSTRLDTSSPGNHTVWTSLHDQPRVDTDAEVCERERQYGTFVDLPPPVPPKSPLRAVHSLLRSPSIGSRVLERLKREEQEKAKRRSVRLAVVIGHKPAYAMSDPGHGALDELPYAMPRAKQKALAVRQHAHGRASWAYGYPPLDMVLESEIPFPTLSEQDHSPRRNDDNGDRRMAYPAYPTPASSHLSHASVITPEGRARKASNKLRKLPRTTPTSSSAKPRSSRPEPRLPPFLIRRALQEPPVNRERKKSIFKRALTVSFARGRKRPFEEAKSIEGMEGYEVEPFAIGAHPDTTSWIDHADRSGVSSSYSHTHGTEFETSRASRHGCELLGDRPHAGAGALLIQSQPYSGYLMLKNALNAEGEGSTEVGGLSPALSTESNASRSGQQPYLHPSQARAAHGYSSHEDSLPSASGGVWGLSSPSGSNVAAKNHTTAYASRDILHTTTLTHGVRDLPFRDQDRQLDIRTRGDGLPVVGAVDMQGCGAANASLSLCGGGVANIDEVQGRVSEEVYRHSHLRSEPPLPLPPTSTPLPSLRTDDVRHQMNVNKRPRVLTKRSRSQSTSRSSRPSRNSCVGSTSGSSTSHTSSMSMSSSQGWPSSPTSVSSSEPQNAFSSPESSTSSSACPPSRPHSYFTDLDLSSTDWNSKSAPILRPEEKNMFAPFPLLCSRQADLFHENSHAPRKLTKRRPSSCHSSRHHHSTSAPMELQSQPSWSPASPPGIVVSSHDHQRGLVSQRERSEERGRGVDKENEVARRRSKSGSRSRSVLGIKFNSRPVGSVEAGGKSMDGKEGHVSANESETLDFLPPLRPPSPLWAGSCGKLPSPYSRQSHTYDSAQTAQPAHSTTDALTSLAFTGNTGLLSSSALASLTSRLTHRASSGQLYSHANEQNNAPPFVFSVKEYDHAAFDPYAEERERRNSRDSKFSRKAKELTNRSSVAFLRLETNINGMAGLVRKASPVPPVPPLPPKYQHQNQTQGQPIKRQVKPKTRTKEKSPDVLRRWTLAMADVPDEVLVQELERLRMEGRGSRRKRRSTAGTSSNGHSTVEHEKDEKALIYGGPEEAKWHEEWVKLSNESDSDSEASQSEEGEFDDDNDERSPLSERDDTEWKSARRALLCCRELVRTERSYQSRLRQLLAGETETAPPALVLTYVPALLNASEALLSRLEDDPSAWGVSAAFVGVEEEVEAAFVAWCGIVGEIFQDGGAGAPPVANANAGSKAAMSAKTSPTLSPPLATAGLGKRSVSSVAVSHTRPESMYRKRNTPRMEDEASANAGSGSGIGMFTAALGTGLAYSISPSPSLTSHHLPDVEFGLKDRFRTDSRSRSMAAVHTTGLGPSSFSKALKRMSVFTSATSLPTTPTTPVSAPATFSASAGRKTKIRVKNPTVRELAIQPTQRVMRYVLQYRDLLTNTPVESPSRGLVERALESALRIAAKCDRAQGNSAFLRRA